MSRYVINANSTKILSVVKRYRRQSCYEKSMTRPKSTNQPKEYVKLTKITNEVKRAMATNKKMHKSY